ncbi:MAG TPA: bifunctional 2-polyprenyl-6-hydroxyphenol methylase/3-demethylubiquinol 3-O-methyltransferase UbiG [Ktedonobacterales bacterium]|nr:bifunctional 2-polyprenyl-6-hydroxyphenol methylase/3-demethylubiquinol 3-O-methyltransferase UbiG [Ktedonobacterales bacterium]
MPADNTLYQRPGDIWWDERETFSVLRTALNPARFGYFQRVLTERLSINPRDKAALDVGCGGGLLTEEFARLGCRVTGIDPSEPALEVARAHAAASGLSITYRAGVGEALPFPEQFFEIVSCCDVLEHVADLDRVIAEIARVLVPGGVFFFDTINRTLLSKLLAIKLAQEWRLTRVLPPNLHDWSQFIRPAELDALIRTHGLARQEVVGLLPGMSPFAAISAMWDYKRGVISVGELGRRLAFRASRNLSVSYAGYALKAI